MRPLIGITVVPYPEPGNARTGGRLELNYNYAQAVCDAGGVPLLIPPQADAAEIMARIHGLLIPGGADIDPAHYGADPHRATQVTTPERYPFEKALLDAAPADLPVLGVCYGCQLLAVAAGGTLVQHLPDTVGHSQDEGGTSQGYDVETDTKLGDAVGAIAQGESWHHQSVDDPGRGMRVAARNSDGTVEAIEATDRDWTIGVQWHPERSPGATSHALFREFVARASAYRERR